MKKTLIVASLLAFSMTAAFAEENFPPPPFENGQPPMENGKFQPPPPPHNNKMNKTKTDFEKKLKLTDTQKAQAKEIRQKGHEQMRPIMEKMRTQQIKADVIKSNNKLSDAEKVKRLEQLNKETLALKKEARELRIKNMQEFEAILTPKQKKTLEKMKKEGKKNFKKQHPKKPPCCPPPYNCNKGK